MILSGLARWAARQFEKASLSYAFVCRRTFQTIQLEQHSQVALRVVDQVQHSVCHRMVRYGQVRRLTKDDGARFPVLTEVLMGLGRPERVQQVDVVRF